MLSSSFSEAEFRCSHCGVLKLHPGFIETLQLARHEFSEPMKITSGCRCKAYNAQLGGHPRSLHVCDEPYHADKGQQGCLAADIAAVDGAYRGRLFVVLWRRGFSIGWNAKKGFLHADLRTLIGMPQTTFDY